MFYVENVYVWFVVEAFILNLIYMRKLLFFLSVVVAFTSCTSDYSENCENSNDETVLSEYNPNRRSFSEAVEIAQNSIKILQGNTNVSRGSEPARTLNFDSGVKAICQTVSRSTSSTSNNDTLLYIFNFNDEQGFAVVSASRQTEGLIAVTESGSYDPAVSTGNPGFEMYMNTAKAYVEYKDKTSVTKDGTMQSRSDNRMYKPVYDTVYYQKIEPKVSVRWGQEGITGQFFSNKIAGCGNIAMAQIISYFKYPSTLTLTFPERDVNYTTLDWTAICKHIYTNFDANRDDADKQIGTLTRQLSVLSKSQYYDNATGTDITESRKCMQSLGYNVGSITNYNQILADNGATDPDVGYPLAYALANGELIYMRGGNSDGEGHVWVVDGCFYVKALHRMMCTYDGTNWFVAQELGTERTCHNHINWGWDGAQNGYFESSILNAYNAFQKDPEYYFLANGQNADFYDNAKYFCVWH